MSNISPPKEDLNIRLEIDMGNMASALWQDVDVS